MTVSAGTTGRVDVNPVGPRCSPLLATIGLLTVAAALLVDVAALSVDLIRLRRLRAGRSLETVGLDFSTTLSKAANVLVPGSVLLAGLAFLWWFWCCYRRLGEGGHARWPHQAAVLGWAVPLANLVVPPSIMRELVVRPGRASSLDSGPILVVGWWILWVEGSIIHAVLRFITPTTNAGWTNWQASALLADLMLLASIACAIALLSLVDSRQDQLDAG